jgi:ABC-2 type transport system ATP-binding protein
MQDVESLTNRVLLIGKGQVLLDGTMEEWRSHLQEEKRLEVCYSSAYLEKDEMKPYVEALSGTRIEAWEEGRMVVAYHPKKHSVSEIIGSICTKFELTNVKMMEQEADELIVSLYKEYQI